MRYPSCHPKALSDSPLNDAKIAFAKMQAGDFDEQEYTTKVVRDAARTLSPCLLSASLEPRVGVDEPLQGK